MKSNPATANVSPLVWASYTVLFAGLATGTLLAPFSVRGALLSLAVVFGWFQIGGL
jgi:hypothetical protein